MIMSIKLTRKIKIEPRIKLKHNMIYLVVIDNSDYVSSEFVCIPITILHCKIHMGLGAFHWNPTEAITLLCNLKNVYQNTLMYAKEIDKINFNTFQII